MSTARYRDREQVDFVVVGSGAAGGVIARELARAGLSVVLFEQGPRLTVADFEHDELKYWFDAGLCNDVLKNPQTFRDEFVCDGSSLVTSGRGQPTLTIQALAFRAAEHITRFARRNEL